MGHALAQHDRLLRAAIEGRSGTVIKTTGDGMLAVFTDPVSAIDAALAAQRAMREEAWGETGPLRVRMALHSGEAEARDGDYFGPALNRVARILAIAHGGQIVCSAVGGRARGRPAATVDRARRSGLPPPARHRPARAGLPGGRPGPAAHVPAASLAQHAPLQPAGPADQLRRPRPGAWRGRGPARPASAGHPDRHGWDGQDTTDARGRGPPSRPIPGRRLARRAGAPRRPRRRSPSEVARALGAPEIPGYPRDRDRRRIRRGQGAPAAARQRGAPRRRDRPVRRTAARECAGPPDPHDEPRGAGGPGRGRAPAAVAVVPAGRRPSVGRDGGRPSTWRAPPRPRRSGCSPNVLRSVDPAFAFGESNVGLGRRDLPPARRDPARDRARGRSRLRHVAGRHRDTTGRPVPAPHRRSPDIGPASADVARPHRLELGPAHGRGPPAPATARGVHRRLDRAGRRPASSATIPMGWTRWTSSTVSPAWSIARSCSSTARPCGTGCSRRSASTRARSCSLPERPPRWRTGTSPSSPRLAIESERPSRGPAMVDWLDRLDAELDNLGTALEWGLEAEPWTAVQMAASLLPYWAVRVMSQDNDARIVAAVEIFARASVLDRPDADPAQLALAARLLGEAGRLWAMSGRERGATRGPRTACASPSRAATHRHGWPPSRA